MNILYLANQCGLSHLFIANEHNSTADQLRTIAGLEKFAELVIEESKNNAWISIKDKLPESQQIVLVVNGRQRRCVMYVSKHSINVEDRDFEEGAEYFEDEDAGYWPEGWYEENSHDEMSWDIDFTPTHWQPFPALPPQNDKETV